MQCTIYKLMLVDAVEVVVTKMLSLPVSAKWQCVIWDNTTHVEVSAPHNTDYVLD